MSTPLPPSAPIVIGGATGNTGAAAIKVLLAHDIPVRALVRDPTKAAKVLGSHPLLELYPLEDLCNYDALLKAYQGTRGVYVMATNMSSFFRALGAQAQAAKDANVPQVVLLSTAWIEYPEKTIVGTLHKAIEDFFDILKVPSFTSVRPDQFFSNVERQQFAIAQYGVITNLTFDNLLVGIDPEDIGAVIAQVFIDGPEKHHGQKYTLTTERDQALTAAEMAAVVGKVLGKEVKSVPMEPEAWMAQMRPHLPDPELQAVMECGFTQRTNFKPSGDVRKVLGRAPRSFEEYVRANISKIQA